MNLPTLLRPALAAIGISFAAAPATAGPPKFVEEAQSFLAATCRADGISPEACEENGAGFVRDYEAAMRGNYQAQRNVAFTLSGRDPRAPVMPNFVQGCAWRLVITMAGHAQAGSGDAANLKLECGRLSEAERAAASGRAAEILRQIEANKARARR